MSIINSIPRGDAVSLTAERLKGKDEIKAPVWASIVKTGVSRERPPADEDWWYSRSASILLKIHKYGPIGVSKLRTYYGGKKNRGVRPEKFFRGSGNIIRKIFQQLEKCGFAKQAESGNHKGRIITSEGNKFLKDIVEKQNKSDK